MDKIAKFLKKLTKKERLLLLKVLEDVKSLNLDNYDVKSIRGHQNTFRIKKGKIRIVFVKTSDYGIPLNIAYRKDAYKDL